MEQILKSEVVAILNKIQRGSAPRLAENEIVPFFVRMSEHKFDLVDSKDGSPIRDYETGTAHYINGNEGDTYDLKIICYDDFLHQFTYDDGNGHTHVSRLKDGVRVSDFLVYEEAESKALFIVHELSEECSGNKIKVARKQLSDTLNQLYQSEKIGKFIDGFKYKLCFLSAKDSRRIVTSEGMADGFNEIYKVLPEPIQFNWGQIGTHKFSAFETSYVYLLK
ncbi:MAG: hypothetical protein J6V33_09545 [Bacteroidales bacterium]|nr:hypothetical protein [Bacteroidales bacterium]